MGVRRNADYSRAPPPRKTRSRSRPDWVSLIVIYFSFAGSFEASLARQAGHLLTSRLKFGSWRQGAFTSSAIREPYAGLIYWKVFRVARHEQAILSDRARPDNRVRQLKPIFSPQPDCFFSHLGRQRHDAKMTKEPAADVFIRLSPCAGQYFHP